MIKLSTDAQMTQMKTRTIVDFTRGVLHSFQYL